ncbi:MAG: alpha/beta hydrolase [Bacteroidota bacterium]|nr:alpha/beta hydrolase [Bacteroidota bacterium]
MQIKNQIIPGYNNKPMAVDIFYKNQKKLPVIIYHHGFNGFKDWANFDLIASQFAEAGFVFVKFNTSHNGTTPQHPEDFVDLDAFGNNNYTKELFDLDQILKWICEPTNPHEPVLDLNNIFLIGHSRGGGVAILKTAEDKRIKKLVTWASVAESKTPWGNWTKEKMEDWKQKGVAYYANSRTNQQMPLYYQLYLDHETNSERLDIAKAARSITIPWLICHGTKDDAVPVEQAHLLKEAALHAELFLVESDHVFDRKHPWEEENLPFAMQQIVEKTIHFFQKS